MNLQEIFLWYFEQKGVDNPERFLGVNEGVGVNAGVNGVGSNLSPQPSFTSNVGGVGQAVPDNLSLEKTEVVSKEQAPENSGESNKNIEGLIKLLSAAGQIKNLKKGLKKKNLSKIVSKF